MMKFRNNKRVAFANLVRVAACVALVAIAPLAITSCSTGQYSTQKQAATALTVSVDAAMNAWRDWVNAGFASQGQVDGVRNCYDQYYAACQTASKAYAAVAAGQTNNIPAAQIAANTVSQISGDLVALVIRYLPADKASALKAGAK